MDKKTEALKLALEALEWINRVNAMEYEYQQKARESLNAIYEALAEQPAPATELREQEPVAWYRDEDGIRIYYESKVWDNATPLYTSPPAQRKPLTDEEIEDIWADCPADWDDKINVLTLARAIEAAHGIKGDA